MKKITTTKQTITIDIHLIESVNFVNELKTLSIQAIEARLNYEAKRTETVVIITKKLN